MSSVLNTYNRKKISFIKGKGSYLYTKKEKMYIYDNKQQYIKYEDGYITTINKLNKQVVYDLINKKDVTIFDLLIGNNKSIHL